MRSNTKKTLKDIIFFYFVLVTGSGSALVASFDPRYNLAGTSLFMLAFAWLVINNLKSLADKRFLIIMGVVLSWLSLHYVKDSDFQYFTYAAFVIIIVAGYVIACQYKDDIPKLFENSVFYLCCISLVFWTLELLIGSSNLAYLAPFKSAYGADGGSFLLYTINIPLKEDSIYLGLPRNSGFAWEPGRFASIICLALAFHLIRHRGVIKINDSHFCVCSVALLTTLSTTGYSAYLTLLMLNLIFSKRVCIKTKLFMLCGLTVLVICALKLPFMEGKIMARLDSENYFTNTNYAWLESSNEMFTVDRFEGLKLDALNFLHDPIFGYGLADRDRYISAFFSENLTTSNGLTKTLAQFGLLLGIPFFYLVIKSLIALPGLFGYNKATLIIIFTLISISYDFYNDPIILSIIFFPLMHLKRNRNVVLNNNCMLEQSPNYFTDNRVYSQSIIQKL